MARKPLPTVPFDDLYEGDKIRVTRLDMSKYIGIFLGFEKAKTYWLKIGLQSGSRPHAIRTSDILAIEFVKKVERTA